MRLLTVTWHWLRMHYYSTALRHLSQFDPTHPDMLEIITEHYRSQAVVKGWNDEQC